MKFVMTIFFALFSLNIHAHHSKGHMMLFEDVEQVISGTQQGAEGSLFLLMWTAAFILLLLGFVRWWKARL